MARFGFICRDGYLYGYVLDIKDIPFICEKKTFELNLELVPEPELKLKSDPEHERESEDYWDLAKEPTIKPIEHKPSPEPELDRLNQLMKQLFYETSE